MQAYRVLYPADGGGSFSQKPAKAQGSKQSHRADGHPQKGIIQADLSHKMIGKAAVVPHAETQHPVEDDARHQLQTDDDRHPKEHLGQKGKPAAADDIQAQKA